MVIKCYAHIFMLSVVLLLFGVQNTDCGITVMCDHESMTIVVPKTSTEFYLNFTLSDPACKVQSNGSEKSIIYSLYSDCGTTKNSNDSYLEYKNELRFSIGDKTDLISRQTNQSIFIVCLLEVNTYFNLSTGYVVNFTSPGSGGNKTENNNTTTSITIIEENVGKVRINFNMYEDFSKSPINNTKFPLQKKLRDPLFMEIALNTQNNDLKVVVQRCYATPTSNGNDPLQYEIIADRCPLDETLKYNVTQKSLKFSIEAFEFKNSNTDQIYIHCLNLICLNTSSLAKCSFGCDKRVKRETNSFFDGTASKKEYMVSSEMILIVNEHKGKEQDKANTNVVFFQRTEGKVFLSLIGLTVFIILIGFIIFNVVMCRRKKQTQRIDESISGTFNQVMVN